MLLARIPANCLLLSPLSVVLPVLFPSASAAVGFAHQTNRFFLFVAFLQLVLLVLFVSLCERIRNPIPTIFLDVLWIALIGVALVAVLWEAGSAAVELFAGSAVSTAVLGFALRDTRWKRGCWSCFTCRASV